MSGLTKGHPVKRRYWPYDELISIPRVRVMRALRRFEWATSEDLTIALDLTSDDKLANNHVVALSRITREGLVERDDSTWPYRYRLTAKGRAELAGLLQRTDVSLCSEAMP